MAYGSDDGLTAWLAARGHALPAAAPTKAALRQRATDYINAEYGMRLTGDRTVDPLFSALENAAYAASWYEANNPGALSVAASQGGAVKRKKIDTLEKEYFEGSGNALADATVKLSSVEGILAPFLTVSGPAVFVV